MATPSQIRLPVVLLGGVNLVRTLGLAGIPAVVAMPDPVLGERACAYLMLRDGSEFTLAAMREFLAGRGVARFKWPERIEIVTMLPLTNVGKIKKTELRRDIEQKLAREQTLAADSPTGPAALANKYGIERT